MYTSFVSDCKSTLSSLWESVQRIHAQQAQNDTMYRDAYLDEQNAKLEQQKKADCAAAREKINDIMSRATEDAAELDKITPLDIDMDSKADRRVLELLSGKYTLNAEQLQHILDNYIPKNNRALLNAVETFCNVRGMKLVRATTASRRGAIEKIRASALGVVDRIASTSYRNAPRKGTFELDVGVIVRDFCVDSDFAAAGGTYQELGQTFAGELVPATVKKENEFDFHFQSVRGDAKAG